MKTVGEIVKYLRKGKHWTQTELAQHSGVSQSFISDLENGAKEATTGTLQQLADAFELPIQALFPENVLSLATIERLLPPYLSRKLRDEEIVPYLILAIKAKEFEITPERLEQIIELLRKQ